VRVAPHQTTVAICLSAKVIENGLVSLESRMQETGAHLRRLAESKGQAAMGSKVFIGHGHAAAWRDLKDFVQDRLRLPYDEFNRVSVAGVTNAARLSAMMNDAAVALVVLTAEDERVDGALHARENAIHEAGLFQGHLGFDKAIVLLEDGCAEFSNIQGLGQLRFPAGRISAVFEDVRRFLEREGLMKPSSTAP
jgi:predicted nucleotide-binding protein